MKKFVLKRKDTGKEEQLWIEEDKQVDDLLEKAIVILKGGHSEGEHSLIEMGVSLSKLDKSKKLIIEDNVVEPKKQSIKEEEREKEIDETFAQHPQHTRRTEQQTPFLGNLQDKTFARSKKMSKTSNKDTATSEKAMLFTALAQAASTEMELKGGEKINDIGRSPYVVLLGNVGTGKSTVVEKLTGAKGRSSMANKSVTKTSELFWVPDGSLLVSDTPGANSMTEKLEHNVWIAGALSFRPVSMVFIVVKAETRIDSVVDNVRKYADCFLDLPMDVVGILVTHMDTVEWTKKDIVPHIDRELGMDIVICTSVDTLAEDLHRDVLTVCTVTHDLTINHSNFLKLFKIPGNHRKVLQCTSSEVKKFKDLKKQFYQIRNLFKGNELVDLIFEFQAWMEEQIIDAKKRIAKENNFTFLGDGAANEAGHVANMTNQLRMVLFDVRTEALEYQTGHGVNDLRKCPHCGLVWANNEGGDYGETTCGNRPSAKNDVRDPDFMEMGTFTFSWSGQKLTITRIGSKSVHKCGETVESGCGNTINWSDMAKVQVPPEFTASQKVSTGDVKNPFPSVSAAFEKMTGCVRKNLCQRGNPKQPKRDVAPPTLEDNPKPDDFEVDDFDKVE